MMKVFGFFPLVAATLLLAVQAQAQTGIGELVDACEIEGTFRIPGETTRAKSIEIVRALDGSLQFVVKPSNKVYSDIDLDRITANDPLTPEEGLGAFATLVPYFAALTKVNPANVVTLEMFDFWEQDVKDVAFIRLLDGAGNILGKAVTYRDFVRDSHARRRCK